MKTVITCSLAKEPIQTVDLPEGSEILSVGDSAGLRLFVTNPEKFTLMVSWMILQVVNGQMVPNDARFLGMVTPAWTPGHPILVFVKRAS